MVRKALAVTCCLSLLITGAGVQSLLAAISDGSASKTYTVQIGGKLIAVPEINPEPGSGPADIGKLLGDLKDLRVNAEERGRALRLAEHLAQMRDHPGEIRAAIERFHENISRPGANQEQLLAHLIDGLQPYVSYVEKSTTKKLTVVDDGTNRCELSLNDGRVTEETWQVRLSTTVTRIVVEGPPDRSGKKPLEQVAFAIGEGGRQTKLVWSRQLLEYAKDIKMRWFDMPSQEDRIDDPAVKDSVRDVLRLQQKTRREKYVEAGIDDIIKALDEARAERFKTGSFDAQQVERFHQELLGLQIRLQNFEDDGALREAQKRLLYDLIDYFVQASKLEANPISEKDLAKMDTNEIQKMLNDFENGAYFDNGLAGWIMKKAKIRPDAGKYDPEKHMPVGLRLAVSKATRSLGLAKDAQDRLMKIPQERDRERDTVREELSQWTQQAVEQIQLYELLQSTGGLEMFRDGEDPREIQLKPRSIPMANQLVAAAQGFGGKDSYQELEERTNGNLMRGAAATFRMAYANAKSMQPSEENLKEPLGILVAKAQGLQDLFLSREFEKYSTEASNLQAYRKDHATTAEGGDSTYYKDKVEGGLFKYFNEHRSEETEKLLLRFKTVTDKLKSLNVIINSKNANPNSVQAQLAGLQGVLESLFRDLGIGTIPDPQKTEDEARDISIFRQWLNNASGQIRSNMDIFSAMNSLDLMIEKQARAKNIKQTRSKSWLNNLSEHIHHWVNLWGAGDWAGDKVVQLRDDSVYRMFATKEGRARLGAILELMDHGQFNEAFAQIRDMDPNAAKRGVLRGYLDRDSRAAEEYLKLRRIHGEVSEDEADRIIQEARSRQTKKVRESGESLMTQPLAGDDMAAVDGALNSAYAKFDQYRFWHTVGTMAWGFIVMTPVIMALGPVIAGAVTWIGKGIGAAADLLIFTRTGLIYQIWRYSGQPIFKIIRFAGNMMERGGQHLSAQIGAAKWGQLGSRLGKTPVLRPLMWSAMRYNGAQSAGLAMFSGFNSAIDYKLHPKYYSDGFLKAMGDAAVYNTAWAIENGWEFSFLQIPGAAVPARTIIGRSYQAFGRSVGPGTAMINLAARTANALWKNDVAKAIVTHVEPGTGLKDGFAGYLADGINGIRSETGRMAATGAMNLAFYTDNLFKFALFTSGIQTAVQYAAYKGASLRSAPTTGAAEAANGPEGGAGSEAAANPSFEPTARIKAQAFGHDAAQSAANASFMLIPSYGMGMSRDEIKEQRKRMQGSRALARTGGDIVSRNTFQRAEPSKSEDHKVKLSLWEAPITGLFRLLTFRGMEKASVPVTGGVKAANFETLLRRARYAVEELIGLLLVPKDKDQHFYTRAELRRLARGERMDWWGLTLDAMKRQDQDRLNREDVIFVVDETRDAAKALLGTKLQKRQYEPLRDRMLAAADRIDVAGDGAHSITDLANVETLRRMAEDTKLDANRDRLRIAFLGGLRRIEQANGGTLPKRRKTLRAAFDRVWNDFMTQIETKDPALRQAMEHNKDFLMGKYLSEYNMDYLNRRIGKVKGRAAIGEEARKIVRTANSILSFGGIRNPRLNKQGGHDVIPKLRPQQEKALFEFVRAVLDGRSLDEAIVASARAESKGQADKSLQIYTFLEASGGKTLLTRVAFIPLEIVRSRNYSGNRLERAWFWASNPVSEVWFMTSNPHLVRQFEEDWGRKPDFKTGSITDALISQQLDRKLNGEATPQRRIVMDEADDPADKPSLTRGQLTAWITFGNPILRPQMEGLKWLQSKLEPFKDPEYRRAKERRIAELRADIAVEESRATRDIPRMEALQRTLDREQAELDNINDVLQDIRLKKHERIGDLRNELEEEEQTSRDPERMRQLQEEIEREEQGISDGEILREIAPRIEAEIPNKGEELASLWNEILGNFSRELGLVSADLRSRGWSDKRLKGMKKEAKKANAIVCGMFGRFFVERKPGDNRAYLSLLWEKIQGQGWRNWLKDDGVATYMRIQLRKSLEFMTLDDPSEVMRIDKDKRTVIPIHYGQEMPTLATEFRGPAQLLLMQELASEGARWDDRLPARLDLPLEDSGIVTFGEALEREKKLGRSDFIKTSGTGAEDVESGLAKKLGTIFANGGGRTKLPAGIVSMQTDAGGHVASISGKDQNSDDFSRDPLYQQIKVPYLIGRQRYAHPENVRLALYNALKTMRAHEEKVAVLNRALGLIRAGQSMEARKQLSRVRGRHEKAIKEIFRLLTKGDNARSHGDRDGFYAQAADKTEELAQGKALVMLAPRSLNEVELMETAIIGSGLATKDQIVKFFPDYVYRMKEGYEKAEMLKENNADALAAGTARFVLNVPEIGGRGTDMDLKKYSTLLAEVIAPEKRNITAIEQFYARFGLGRAPLAERLFYNVTSTSGLRENSAYVGTLQAVLQTLSEQTAVPAGADPVFRGIYTDLRDPAKRGRLFDPASAEFRDLVTRMDVYQSMVLNLMKSNQRKANEESQIASPPQVGVTPISVRRVSIAVGTAVGAVVQSVVGIWGAPLAAVGGSVAMDLTRRIGNLQLAEEDKVPPLLAGRNNRRAGRPVVIPPPSGSPVNN